MIAIRAIRASDAKEFLRLCEQTDRETWFMMFEPAERRSTVAQERARIEQILRRDNQLVLVAEEDGHLVGRLTAKGGDFRRNRHSAEIVIGILRSHWGQGIGTRLFAMLEDWAREYGIQRLELTVRVDNDRAIRLYEKMGFEIEGTRRRSLFVDGQFFDEYWMSKLVA